LWGLKLDLGFISKIKNPTRVSVTIVQKAVQAGDKGRTLGDSVTNTKMWQVGDACAKMHSMSPLD
jgi:autophagy-related protein 11